MSSPALQLVPYALVAAMSPLGFAATLAVMGSGRLKALVFGCAFIAGQLVACSILILIGAAALPDHGARHPTLQAALEIVFRRRTRRARIGRAPTPPTRGSLERTVEGRARAPREAAAQDSPGSRSVARHRWPEASRALGACCHLDRGLGRERCSGSGAGRVVHRFGDSARVGSDHRFRALRRTRGD